MIIIVLKLWRLVPSRDGTDEEVCSVCYTRDWRNEDISEVFFVLGYVEAFLFCLKNSFYSEMRSEETL